MGMSLSKRFFKVIEDEMEKLKEQEGNEINPTGWREEKAWSRAFDDYCTYIYSLYSLDFVIHSLKAFGDDLEKSKNDMSKSFYEADITKLRSLPAKIAFNLRGYIGAFSEESMALDEDRLKDLHILLFRWSSIGMDDGEEQNALYQFLWNYALTQLYDGDDNGVLFSQEDKDRVMALRVLREMKAFKEVLTISTTLVMEMFNDVWAGYNEGASSVALVNGVVNSGEGEDVS